MRHDPLLQILILLAASVCVVAGARKLKLPAIVGYLAVGMLLGPHALSAGGEQRDHAAAGRFRRGVPGLHPGVGILVAAPPRHALGGARRRRRSGARDDRHGGRRCRASAGRCAGGRRRGGRRGGHVLHGDHHCAAHRAIGEQSHPWAAGGGHLPVPGSELPPVARPRVALAGGGDVAAVAPGGCHRHRGAGAARWCLPRAAGCCVRCS